MSKRDFGYLTDFSDEVILDELRDRGINVATKSNQGVYIIYDNLLDLMKLEVVKENIANKKYDDLVDFFENKFNVKILSDNEIYNEIFDRDIAKKIVNMFDTYRLIDELDGRYLNSSIKDRLFEMSEKELDDEKELNEFSDKEIIAEMKNRGLYLDIYNKKINNLMDEQKITLLMEYFNKMCYDDINNFVKTIK